MADTGRFLELLKALAEELPSFIAIIACIVFALSRRQRYPKVALTLVIGLVLLLVHLVVINIVYTWVPGWFIKPENYDPVLSRNVYLVLGLITNTITALIFAVLLAAVFIQRDRLRTTRP
jgi:hypothetical protein